MAKAFISSLLERQLGKYIDGLSSESLKVGLWNGQVELEDLSLKQDALREFNLPVRIIQGRVKKVKLLVPWNSLGSSSVELLIEGVTFIAEPNTELPSKSQLNLTKHNQLERADLLRRGREKEEENTYLARLFARIVDNLQITLKDIHFRYEDRLTDPEHPFSVGLELKEFRYVTTDASGNQVFVDRSHVRFQHKVTYIQSVGIYWNQLEGQETAEYLLYPTTLSLRLIKNESFDYSVHPKWEIQLNIENIEFGLSSDQFDQILRLERAFSGRLAVEAHFKNFSAPIYPVCVDSIEWWRYLSRRAVNGARKYTRVRWCSIKRACEHRKKYLALWKQYHGDLESLTKPDKHAMSTFEEYYPIEFTLLLRSWAERQVEKEQKANSWYNYFFASDESALLSDQGRQDVEKALDVERLFEENKVPEGSSIATVRAHVASGVLHLFTTGRHELLSVKYDGEIVADIQPSGWFLQFSLHKFLINTEKPRRFQNILTVSNDEQNTCLSVRFWSAETKLRVTALSFYFVLDFELLLEIKAFFTTTHSIAAWSYAAESLQGWVNENEAELYAMLETRKKWDIEVDMEAPVCLIPDAESSVLVFDLGHFVLTNQSHQEDPNYDNWKVHMDRLQIQLCNSKGIDQDTNRINPALVTRIVHEFSIEFSVQTLVTTSEESQLAAICAHAKLPRLALSLSEADVIVLGKIQSSLLSRLELGDLTTSNVMDISPTVVKYENQPSRCLAEFEFSVDEIVLQVSSLSNGPVDILETKLTGAKFNLSTCTDYTALTAHVEGLEMKDKFHAENSPFYLLAFSASENKKKLIEIQMEFKTDVNVINCQFNTLTVQWNPSTISILYRIIEQYLDTFSAGVPIGVEYPTKRWEISTSLNHLGVTFNKDEQNRALLTLSMHDTKVQFILVDETRLEISGQVGNLRAEDRTIQNSLYPQILGLQESSTESLIRFTYCSSLEASSLDLYLSPLKIVYNHQQAMELVDYLFEGILGILQTTIEYNSVVTTLFKVEISSPVILLPVHRLIADHVSVTASLLSLSHEPKAVLECGTEVDRKTIDVRNVSATLSTDGGSILEAPLELQVLVHDRVNSSSPDVPRFNIQFVMPAMHVRLLRPSYVILCNIIMGNFGEDLLQGAFKPRGSDTDTSYRPHVDYAYADPSIEMMTMCLAFRMISFTCTIPDLAVFEMKELNVSLWTLKDQNPNLAVTIESMVVTESLRIGIHPVHRQVAKLCSPLLLKYEWLTDQTTILSIEFNKLSGIVISQLIHPIIDFFHLRHSEFVAEASSRPNPTLEIEAYIKVNVLAGEIQLIALEDFSSSSSQHVKIKADFNITAEMDNKEVKVDLEAYGIEAAIISTALRSNCPAEAPIQLLEPTKLVAKFMQTDQQDVFKVEIDPIQVFMSYQDIMLLYHIFQPMAQLEGSHPLQNETLSTANVQLESTRERRRYFECEIKTVQFILINDYSGCDMPVVQLQMNKCNLFINGTADEFSGGGYFHFCAFYYTPKNSQWHTLFDPWTLDTTIQGQNVHPKRQVLLTATDPLTMYITNDMLQAFASVAGTLNSTTNSEASDRMYSLINETGYPISYQLNDREHFMDPLGKTSIDFFHRKGKGTGIKRYDGKSDRILTIKLAEEYQPVHLVRFDEIGTYAFPLLYSNGSLSKVSIIADTRLVNGKIQLTLSSKVRVCNHTTLTLELLVSDPIWPSPFELGKVAPNESISIPLNCIQASELRCRPVNSTTWSSPVPLKHLSDQEPSFSLTLNPSMTLRVLLRRRNKVVSEFSLYHPIQIVNKVPVAIEFQIRNRERATKGLIESGNSAYISQCDTSSPLFGIFRIDGCSVSKWIELKPNKVFKTRVKRQNQSDLNLLIQLDKLTTAKCLVVTCLVECWLINLTPLYFIYGNDTENEAWAENTSSKITPSSSGRIRVCLDQRNWSGTFDPDPKRLTWHDECLQLFKNQCLYEFGVSADYSTRSFGTFTTLVTFFPRYLIQSELPHLLLIREHKRPSTAIHQITSGDNYMMYWISGSRGQISLGNKRSDDWSEPFSIDKEGIHETWLDEQWVQISIKRGEVSNASLLISISPIAQPLGGSTNIVDTNSDEPEWSLAAEFSGLRISIASKEQFIETNPLFGTVEQSNDEFVAELCISSVRLDVGLSDAFRKFHLSIESAVLYDRMLNTKHEMVLCPVYRTKNSLIQVFYHEILNMRYKYVQNVSLSIQPVKIQTTMTFVEELSKLVIEILETYAPAQEDFELHRLLALPMTASEGGSQDISCRIYFNSLTIDPIRVNLFSFTREKGQIVSDQMSFWLRNLKVQIQDAWLILEPFHLKRVFGTTQLIQNSVSSFYIHSIKGQALSLLDSVQVTSLVTNLVTDGVSNLVSTLIGATQVHPELSGGYSFPLETDLSNSQLLRKHSEQFRQSSSREVFFKSFCHLIYDWDMNHQGIEARKCIGVSILNSSKEAIRLHTQLKSGAELVILPYRQEQQQCILSSVSTLDHEYWDPHRAVVVFGFGSLMPSAWNFMMNSSQVKFSIESNAFRAIFDDKGGRVEGKEGFTANFIEQQTEKWWSRYVLILSDDLNDETLNYSVEFTNDTLGILARQEKRNVVQVKEYSGQTTGTSENIQSIQNGDLILAVNDIPIQTTAQFKQLVRSLPRPITLRFKRQDYNLFG